MNKVKLNWIHIFKDHMQKVTRLSDFHYPYVILISKFLHYFEVDLEEELSEVVKSSSEINNGSLSNMGFTKTGGRWWVNMETKPAQVELMLRKKMKMQPPKKNLLLKHMN